ncbi:MAG: alpha/beta hydrolase fold domain-containing protein [Steroidobacteraceae bacterium]
MTIPAFTVPLSSYASPEARAMFQRVLEDGRRAPPLTAPVAESRAFYDRINTDRARRMERLYPVKIESREIGGMPAQVVTPAKGVAPEQAHRVLINLHGGAFLWGAGSGGLVESIPIAAIGGIKVMTVDYRQGPEHVFPAASEDVAAVYRALLEQYPARNIGIYGCSAGGILTGEAVAWFIREQLPVPGAIGMFCGAVAGLSGDSAYLAPVLNGDPPPGAPLKVSDLPYFRGASATDPLVFPANSRDVLARFPPTLLITGTRDFTMSSVLRSQRLLSDAGTETELHVWDGMWHAFFSDPEMPESKEAYDVMVRFFDRHLARSACPDEDAVAAYVADVAARRSSRGFGQELSLADAACARGKLIARLPRALGPRIGYKTAFTNPAAQKRMGVTSPAWAVMFSGFLLPSGSTVSAEFGAVPRFEPDLIVVVKDAGLASATTTLEALTHLEAVQPFIELPDLMLDFDARGPALIATNIGFRGGVLGPRIKVEPTEEFLRALAHMIVVTEDGSGRELSRARGDALMGHPIDAALWLARALHEAGIGLEPGDLLSLGAFQPPSPPRNGTSIAVRYVGLPGDPTVAVHFDR